MRAVLPIAALTILLAGCSLDADPTTPTPPDGTGPLPNPVLDLPESQLAAAVTNVWASKGSAPSVRATIRLSDAHMRLSDNVLTSSARLLQAIVATLAAIVSSNEVIAAATRSATLPTRSIGGAMWSIVAALQVTDPCLLVSVGATRSIVADAQAISAACRR